MFGGERRGKKMASHVLQPHVLKERGHMRIGKERKRGPHGMAIVKKKKNYFKTKEKR